MLNGLTVTLCNFAVSSYTVTTIFKEQAVLITIAHFHPAGATEGFYIGCRDATVIFLKTLFTSIYFVEVLHVSLQQVLNLRHSVSG
jgi:hypothetical protein